MLRAAWSRRLIVIFSLPSSGLKGVSLSIAAHRKSMDYRAIIRPRSSHLNELGPQSGPVAPGPAYRARSCTLAWKTPEPLHHRKRRSSSPQAVENHLPAKVYQGQLNGLLASEAADINALEQHHPALRRIRRMWIVCHTPGVQYMPSG